MTEVKVVRLYTFLPSISFGLYVQNKAKNYKRLPSYCREYVKSKFLATANNWNSCILKKIKEITLVQRGGCTLKGTAAQILLPLGSWHSAIHWLLLVLVIGYLTKKNMTYTLTKHNTWMNNDDCIHKLIIISTFRIVLPKYHQ